MAKKKDKRERKYSVAKEVIEKRGSGFDSTSIKLPDGISLFSFKKEGTYRLDILPYEVGEGNPVADKGVLHYERTYHVHRGIGPESKTYCCLTKNWGEPCPVCEHTARMKKDGEDWDTIKEFMPKERQLWVMIDKKDEDQKIQIMDQSYHLWGKKIDEAIKGDDEGEGYENFFHLEGGMTLKVTATEETYNKRAYYSPSRIEFKPREDYDEDILESVPCLDDLLNKLSYKELKRIFEMTGGTSSDEDEDEDSDSDDDGDTPPKKKVTKKATAKKPDPDEDDEDSDDSEDEDTPPKKKTPAKKSVAKKPDPDDEDDDEPEDPSDLDDDEDEDMDEDEDSDDGDEDDEPPTPKKKPTRKK